VGNARRLIDVHGRKLRYVAERKQWFLWDGRRWRLDVTREIQRSAQNISRRILREASYASDPDEADELFKWARRSRFNAAINNMIAQATSDLRVVVEVARLDRDPWAFNVRNGTLDLRTGPLRHHDPGDLITMISDVEFSPGATCPTWESVVERLLPDPELRRFLQLIVGCAMTGDTTEQVLPVFHGSGANGKTTITNSLLNVMGEYGAPAPPRLLMLEKHSEHPTQVADLLG
jgi:putative DNA primase/helicase